MAFVASSTLSAGATVGYANSIYAFQGVTFVAEGGPRIVNQMLVGRGVTFSGNNTLTFSSTLGSYNGVSGVSGDFRACRATKALTGSPSMAAEWSSRPAWRPTICRSLAG